MGKLELSWTVGKNVKCCSCFRKQPSNSSKCQAQSVYDWAFLLDIYPREMKAYFHIKIYMPMFLASVFIKAKKCKQPKYPSTNWWIYKMWYIHTVTYSTTEEY